MHRVNVRFVFRKFQGKNPELQDHGIIYAVICVDKQESEPFSTGEPIWQKNWLGTKLLSKDEFLNQRLQNVRNRAKAVATMLDVQNEDVTPKAVLDIYLQSVRGEKKESWTVLYALQKYYESKNGKIKPQTLVTIQTRINFMERWLESVKKSKMLLQDLSLKDLSDFQSQSTAGLDFTSKTVQLLKSAAALAQIEGQRVQAEIFSKKLSWQKIQKPTFVSDADFAKINALQLRPHLEKVRDAWTFARHSCLHFVDYYHLKEAHFFQDNESDWFIIKDREKTGIEQRVPLNDTVVELIQKYGGVENLPKISPKSASVALNLVNRYLAQICELAKVPKFTFSNARDSFLNELYNEKGVRPETENSIAGWTTQREAQRYRRATLATLKKDMFG